MSGGLDDSIGGVLKTFCIIVSKSMFSEASESAGKDGAATGELLSE